jgi:hydroxymethylbilane synthase
MVDPIQLRLGTRASKLARWQADWAAQRLRELGHAVEIILVTTEGDVATGPLGQIGGQGLFTKRIQQALLDNEIDFAVHSLKDLPTEAVNGLILAAVPERASCGDALVNNTGATLDKLPEGALIGTGSKRRQTQLLHARPDLKVSDIRGNVDTRLRKLDDGLFDAIVLAEAGLDRLGLNDRITQVLPRSVMLPAVGQGALGLEAREGDDQTLGALARLNHLESESSVLAERSLLAALRAGCLAPVGAWCRFEHDHLQLDAAVLSEDGRQRVSVEMSGPTHDALGLGVRAAEALQEQGAASIIEQARHS